MTDAAAYAYIAYYLTAGWPWWGVFGIVVVVLLMLIAGAARRSARDLAAIRRVLEAERAPAMMPVYGSREAGPAMLTEPTTGELIAKMSDPGSYRRPPNFSDAPKASTPKIDPNAWS